MGLLVLGYGRVQGDRRAAAAAGRLDADRLLFSGGAPDLGAVSTADAATQTAAMGPEPDGLPQAAVAAQTRKEILVHVAGAVVTPGVYHLEQGARVQDAIAAAGGALLSGLPDTLNLAARIEDGDKIYVPDRAAEPPTAVANLATVLPVQSVSAEVSARPRRVQINTASAKELDGLPGITPTTAKAIVEYRTSHGPFKTLEELDAVKGIGPATIEKIRGQIEL